MRKINGEYVYSAKYVTIPFTNTISSIENPYIKVRKSKDGYLNFCKECKNKKRRKKYITGGY